MQVLAHGPQVQLGSMRSGEPFNLGFHPVTGNGLASTRQPSEYAVIKSSRPDGEPPASGMAEAIRPKAAKPAWVANVPT